MRKNPVKHELKISVGSTLLGEEIRYFGSYSWKIMYLNIGGGK